MSLAPQELENTASRYASEAIKFDSQGARGMAIANYQKAIESLVKLIRLYPASKLNQVYKERTNSYQKRIGALREAHGVEPAVDPNASAETQKRQLADQNDRNDLDDMIMKEKPNISWSEVVGLDDVKSILRKSIVYPTKRPDLFPLGWPRGLLLHGPPGCGKTILAAATASEMDGYFINVDASALMSKWLGEGEKNVSKMFRLARGQAEKEGKPVILFIDEIDSLLGTRNSEAGGEVRIRDQFLTEMDGVQNKGKNLMMYTIGATNKPWSLENGFLRRFVNRVYVPLPTQQTRQKLFELYTAPLKTEKVRPAELAKMFDGYSASDIKDVCQAAQLRVVDELFNAEDYHEPVEGEEPPQPRVLTTADFREIMRIRKPSVSPEMTRAYLKWSSQFGAK